MKREQATKFVERQLRDLDVEQGSDAWNAIFENAVEAAEILNKRAVSQYIEQSLELMPLDMRGAK